MSALCPEKNYLNLHRDELFTHLWISHRGNSCRIAGAKMASLPLFHAAQAGFDLYVPAKSFLKDLAQVFPL